MTLPANQITDDSPKQKTEKFSRISVRPKNYRRIALYAIENCQKPVVLMDSVRVDDFSEHGPLVQKQIRASMDFVIMDDSNEVLGFHDHPDEMWIAEKYRSIAIYCQNQEWLKISRQSKKHFAIIPAVSSWPAALASIVFSGATFCMTSLYFDLHWNIMRDHGWLREPEFLKPVYPVLHMVALLRSTFSLLALIWAIWSLKGRPCWISTIAMALALCAMLICTIQT